MTLRDSQPGEKSHVWTPYLLLELYRLIWTWWIYGWKGSGWVILEAEQESAKKCKKRESPLKFLGQFYRNLHKRDKNAKINGGS